MAQQGPSHEPQPEQPRHGDPWIAVAYLVSGVVLYGALGWLADRWLGTSFLVAIGIVLGAVLGTYMTWARFSAMQASAAQAAPGARRDTETDQDDDVDTQEKQ